MEIRIGPRSWYYIERRGRSSVPLVLVHGAGSDHTVWGAVLPHLKGIHLYALDLPGHGRSSRPALTTVEEMARKLVSWIAHTLHVPVILAGHSMGGAIALTMGRRWSPWIRGLLLITTGARLRVHPELLQLLDQRNKEEAANWILHHAFSPQASPDLIETARRQLLRCPVETLRRDYRACNRFDLMEDLHRITAPTTVVGALDDRMTPPKYAEYLDQNLPNARLELIEASGHMVMLEQPQRLAQVIRQTYQALAA